MSTKNKHGVGSDTDSNRFSLEQQKRAIRKEQEQSDSVDRFIETEKLLNKETYRRVGFMIKQGVSKEDACKRMGPGWQKRRLHWHKRKCYLKEREMLEKTSLGDLIK